MMSRLLCVILMSALLLAAHCGIPHRAFAKQQDTKVISVDDHGLTLEVVLPPFKTLDVQGPDAAYQRIRLQGWAKTTESGSPELPLQGILIQAPSSGGIKIEVLEDTFETLQDIVLYPVPRKLPSDNGKPRFGFSKNDGVYQSTVFFPGKPAEVSSRGIMGDVSVARVLIYPFQWNPGTKELRYSSRMRLRVQFELPLFRTGATASLPAGEEKTATGFHELISETIVNYQPPQNEILQTVAPDGPAQLSSAPSLRMEIKQEGIYQLSYPDLRKAGVPVSSVDPSKFQLFNKGSEVALKVSSKAKNSFAAGDSLQFYGQSLNNEYTDTNVYFLTWGGKAGKRISTLNGKVTGKGKKVNSFYDTLHLEENLTIWDGMQGAPEQDYWFWEKLTASAGSPYIRSYTFEVPSPVPDQSGAVLTVNFRGRSTDSPNPNHHTRLRLNGTELGDAHWDGNIAYSQKAALKGKLLKAGTNTLSVEMPGDTGANVDVVYTNWIDVAYWRLFEAVQDSLKFTVKGKGRLEMEISKLSSSGVLIYDVTDPRAVKAISNPSIKSDGARFKAAFEAQIQGAKTYMVSTSSQVKKPDGLKLLKAANLKSPQNGADLILITPKEFLSSVAPLVKLRQQQKLRVKAVAIEDVYNEFSQGLFDPAAIKSFLGYAYAKWKRPAPSSVLLVGDANTDYRDYLKTGKKNRVPAHLSSTAGLGLVPNDNWYVCVKGEDALPEMMIGRISGSSAKAVAGVIAKIIDFETSATYAPQEVLLVSDNDDRTFEAVNDSLVHYLPAGFNADKVYLNNYSSTAEAKADIVAGIDKGMMITNYMGHGAITNWAGEYLFQSSDVPSLSNGGKLTFVVTMNCLNGYFSHPLYYSLSEEFVMAPNKGAVAAFSPSGLGYPAEHEILDSELFSLIFEKEKRTLGIITTQAKITAFSRGASEEILGIMTLLGDPAAQLKKW